MIPRDFDSLVSTDWLAQHLIDPAIRIVDMRGYVTTKQVEPGVEEATYRGALAEYQTSHVPGSVYVDWTLDIIDPKDPVSVQLASPECFGAAMSERGIGDDSHVIVVDHMGGQFATRLWWALKAYGHDKVSVLDGGWNRWVEDGYEVTDQATIMHPAQFTPRYQPQWRVTAEELCGQLGTTGLQLLDARDFGQYSATRRRGPRGGHIPGAINLPREIFFAEGGGFRPLAEIRKILADRGLKPDQPTIAYCNGGVAATVLLFNLDRLGFRPLANYDGSWNEWAARLDLPVA